MINLRTEIEYVFIAMPFWDEKAQQWKPSVKELHNGEFFCWTVYDIGFDEPRFTMPYARAFQAELVMQAEQTLERWKAEHRKHLGLEEE